MLTAYILIYSVTKNLPAAALAPPCSPAAAAPWVEATVRRRQHNSLKIGLKGDQADATVLPVARTAASVVACSGLVLREEEGLACLQPRLAPHPYVVLHARHFKIQLEVVRV